MSAPKGYPSSDKLNAYEFQFSTVEPVRAKQSALSVLAHMTVSEVGTDAAETGSTTSSIKATAHAARRGDVIRFTAGALSGYEFKVDSVSTDNIATSEIMPSAPANGNGFQILRHRYPLLNSDGELLINGTLSTTPGPLLYSRDGADQEVVEDTAVPANNLPLPVKLLDSAGNVNRVSATQSGTWNVTDVSGTVSLPTGAATSALQGTGNTSLSSIDGKITACNTGAVVVSSSALPSGGSTGAKQDTGNTSLASIDGKITAVNTGAVVISSSALPTGAATETTLSAASAKLPASLGAKAGSASLSVVLATDAGLDVIDFIDTTPVLDTSSSNITASAGNPLAIVSSLAANVKAIKVNDTTGEFIGVYTGAALSEVLQCVVGPGEDQTIEVKMSSGERVSLRNMANAAISTGKICIQFLG